MIKQFIVFIGVILFQMSQSHAAFEIRATVSGGVINWDNMTHTSGLNAMVPSTWGTPPMLQAVESWTPASLGGGQQFITNGWVDASTSPVQVVGMEYNTTGAEFSKLQSGMGNNSCIHDSVKLPIIQLTGINCISETKLSAKVKTEPFVFYRPIITLNDNDILSSLEGKKQGVYSIQIKFMIRHYYENNGIRTYRNINETVIMMFNYFPVQLDNIIVQGDGEMDPQYDVVNRKVSAQTKFDITANGYFSDGIQLTLLNGESDYHLVHQTERNVLIPYSIDCAGCSNNIMVEKGKLLHNTTQIGQGGGTKTAITFELNFRYNYNGEILSSGRYEDQVTIMLEPRI
ncbi:hypothetical protein AB8613_14910 [Vibrio sp. BS-M-Sm-2]|uniref:hypothetical protein n=1 Tax=Vibrio sp. BS-M-Sm-2 TaxID=3241167 RepID=UPI0035575531